MINNNVLHQKTYKIRFTLLNLLFIPFAFIIFLALYKYSGNSILFTITYSIFFLEFIYVVNDISKNVSFLLFLGGFFMFLLGADLLQVLFGAENTVTASQAAINHTYISITISLIFAFIGFIIIKKFRFIKINSSKKIRSLTSIRHSSVYIYCITYIFMLAGTIDNAIFVAQYGYVEQYLSYSPHIPIFLVKIGDMCHIAFYTYLATKPSKKEAKKYIILYLIAAVLSIFTGKRFEIIATLMILFFYLLVRNRDIEEEPWVTKKQLILSGLCVPVLMIFAQILGYIRTGLSINNSSPFALMTSFINSVGNSNRIIKWQYDYADRLPSDHLYSFGSLIDYIKYGKISEILGFFKPITGQTVDYALNGNSLAHTITYIISPSAYLSGHGFGSCYIAELYHDFGYFGVALFSLILGIIIANIGRFNFNRPYKTAIYMAMLTTIIRMPRDSYSEMFVVLINYKYWFCIFLIVCLSYFLKRKRTSSFGT